MVDQQLEICAPGQTHYVNVHQYTFINIQKETVVYGWSITPVKSTCIIIHLINNVYQLKVMKEIIEYHLTATR